MAYNWTLPLCKRGQCLLYWGLFQLESYQWAVTAVHSLRGWQGGGQPSSGQFSFKNNVDADNSAMQASLKKNELKKYIIMACTCTFH